MWGVQKREGARIILRFGVLSNWVEVVLFTHGLVRGLEKNVLFWP